MGHMSAIADREDSTTAVEQGKISHMAMWETIKALAKRAKDFLGLWSLLPPSLIAVTGGYLSTGVQWIARFGAFGWFASGLISFVLSAIGFGMIARSRLWRIEARSRARILGDSSPFDPMARVYESKRLYLRDLAPLGRKQVRGKSFVNCEIIGPGTAVLLLQSDTTKPPNAFKDNKTFDVDCIEIDSGPAARSVLAIEFWDCDFSDCQFYNMSLLFFGRQNDTLHWITKDSRQALLAASGGTASIIDQAGNSSEQNPS